jgi:hypothetical protein
VIVIPTSIPSSSQDIVVSGESHSLRCTDFVLNRSEAGSDFTITTAGFEGYGIKEVVETVQGEACCQVPGTASLLSYLPYHLFSWLCFPSTCSAPYLTLLAFVPHTRDFHRYLAATSSLVPFAIGIIFFTDRLVTLCLFFSVLTWSGTCRSCG